MNGRRTKEPCQDRQTIWKRPNERLEPTQIKEIHISSTQARDAILAANKTFMTAYSQGDVATVITTKSAQYLLHNHDVVTDMQALKAGFQASIDAGYKTIELQTLEMEVHGDTGIEVGRFILGGKKGQMRDRGKYLVIWKQEAGHWKIHRDIFNSSLPVSKT